MTSETENYFAPIHSRRQESRRMQRRDVAVGNGDRNGRANECCPPAHWEQISYHSFHSPFALPTGVQPSHGPVQVESVHNHSHSRRRRWTGSRHRRPDRRSTRCRHRQRPWCVCGGVGKTYSEKFGEGSGKKLLDTGADSLVERLKPSAPDLESVYREALRLSILEISPQICATGQPDWQDWFANWDRCLKASVSLSLDEIRPAQLTLDSLDSLFQGTLERLDAQGAALVRRSQSLILQTRGIPDRLLAAVSSGLREHFEENFRTLIVQPAYEQAWKRAEMVFRDTLTATLGRIDERTALLPQVAEDTAATRSDVAAVRRMLEGYFDSAEKRGLLPEQTLKSKDDEIARLSGELRKLQEQLALRSAEPAEAELFGLLKARDLDSAVRLKTREVENRRAESAKLPQDLYELGTIHELRFEWPEALAAYREAWEVGKEAEHGFKYASVAQKLNRFADATTAFEALLPICAGAAERATVLNHLAALYSDTQRLQEAEKAYGEALAISLKLAEANPDVHQSDIADTLNNIAILYRNTKRMRKAEETFSGALATYRRLAKTDPETYMPDVAATLNNLGNLYSDIPRPRKAEEAYREALAIRRRLAKANPDAYLSDVAETLNNLAILFRNTRQLRKAEEAHGEALAIRRRLAEVNPDAYLPCFATTLNNLAVVYCDTKQTEKAEEAYGEALAIYRQLAEASPEAYRPDVAMTLNNLGNLYSDTKRMPKAHESYREALALYRQLAGTNPKGHRPDVAMTLSNLAALYFSMEQITEAAVLASEAEQILQPLWKRNPRVHGDGLAKILWTRVRICEAGDHSDAKPCAIARRALAAAYNPDLKQVIQKLIDRLCSASGE